jgi:hypothetical protein
MLMTRTYGSRSIIACVAPLAWRRETVTWAPRPDLTSQVTIYGWRCATNVEGGSM